MDDLTPVRVVFWTALGCFLSWWLVYGAILLIARAFS